MGFRYEMHCHTNAFSACGKSTPEEMVRKFKNLGYTGLFITEHFAESCILYHKNVSWEEYINTLYSTYERAKTEGDKCGLDVFFGLEYPAGGWAHFLVYGLTKEYLLANDYFLDIPPHEFLRNVRAEGAFVVHAHPFRKASNDLVRLYPDLTHAVETLNANRTDDVNLRADGYAEMMNLPKMAGSDIHHCGQEKLGCIVAERKIKDEKDLFELVKSGEYHIETVMG